MKIIGWIDLDDHWIDHPGQPRKPALLLTFLGWDNYFLGPVGRPVGRNNEAMASAMVRETFRSVCNHSETVALVGAVVVSVGS